MPSLRKLLPSSRLSASMPWGYDRKQKFSPLPSSSRDVGTTLSANNNVTSSSHIPLIDACFRGRRSTRVYPPSYLPLLFLLVVLGFYFATVSFLWVHTDTINTGHARIDALARPLSGRVVDRPLRQRDDLDSIESAYAPGRGTDTKPKKDSSRHKRSRGERDYHHSKKTQKKSHKSGYEHVKSSHHTTKPKKRQTHAHSQKKNDKGSRDEQDYRLSKKTQEKSHNYGYEDVKSTHHDPKPKKRPTHSHSQKKNEPRKPVRDNNLDGRRAIDPKHKDGVIDSAQSGGAETKRENDLVVQDSAKKDIAEGSRVGNEDNNKRMERTVAPDPPITSNDDVVVGLAVTAAVAIVAFLGALLYIFTEKGRRTVDESKRSESATECRSETDSSSGSNSENEAGEPVAPRPHIKSDINLFHAYRSLEPVVQASSNCPHASAAIQFSVTVPSHVRPGQDFRVLADGRAITVKCPPTSKPGEKLQIFVGKGAAIVDEGIEPKEERFVPSSSGTESAEAKKDFGHSPKPIQVCNHVDARGGNGNESAKNPQDGACNVFEVAVPKGVEPGQPFPVMVEGAMIAVTCPTSLSAGRKVVFHLPNKTAVGASIKYVS